MSNDLELKMYGAGLVDEAVAVEEMRRELEYLRARMGSSEPVCPHCYAKLRPIQFKGYYDEFPCWTCDCVHLPGATTETGAYA